MGMPNISLVSLSTRSISACQFRVKLANKIISATFKGRIFGKNDDELFNRAKDKSEKKKNFAPILLYNKKFTYM
jgi:hypothetical protein